MRQPMTMVYMEKIPKINDISHKSHARRVLAARMDHCRERRDKTTNASTSDDGFVGHYANPIRGTR